MLELELEVISSCLVRQGREVNKGIRILQTHLRYSEARINGMYKEVSMQQQGYGLHTLTRGGRQKGSSPFASYSSGSKATTVLGRWSPYNGAFKCVHREETVWALGCSLFEPTQLLLLLDGHI